MSDTSMPKASAQPTDLKPKWRERFEFFGQYGPLTLPQAKAAFKQLPSKKRRLIGLNWLGFFFGPFYWLVLGMWRRALSWWAMIFVIGCAETLFEIVTNIDIPRGADIGITVAIACLAGWNTNYLYYLKMVKGNNGWNPFVGKTQHDRSNVF